MSARRVNGYDDATQDMPVNPKCYDNQEYLEGYREGLTKMVEWANKSLRYFNSMYPPKDELTEQERQALIADRAMGDPKP